MKIYTKTGDKGQTSLLGGERVSKNHPRIIACGDLDELVSYIGLLRCDLPDKFDAKLKKIEEILFLSEAFLTSAVPPKKLGSFPLNYIKELEKDIDEMTGKMPKQTSFILPSKPRVSSLCHVVRSVCRRAERSAVVLESEDKNVGYVLQFLNRLSDYLFTLARYLIFLNKNEEECWIP